MNFYKREGGWGVLVCEAAPAQVWVHFSDINMPGYRALEEGQIVDFQFEGTTQDGFSYEATWMRPFGSGGER